MIQRGILDRVTSTPLGTHLTSDAAANTTTLSVDWTVEFSEAGGLLSLNDVVLAYTAANEDTSTITLTEPLAVAAVTDDQVLSLSDDGEPRSTLEAFVAIDAGEEPVPHDVRSGLEDRITERTPAGSPVLVDTATRTVVGLDDIPAPLDPTTIPDRVPIEAPASSPSIRSVTGNAGGLVVVTDPFLATTLVDYLIDGVPVATDQRTPVLLLTVDGAGNPLAPDTDYVVTVVAHNVVAAAPSSLPVTGRLNPGVSMEQVIGVLQAGEVYTARLEVGPIRINGDEGQVWEHSDGTVSQVPIQGSPSWRGTSVLDRLDVLESLSLRGTEMNVSGGMRLTTGVDDPSQPLTVTTAAYAATVLPAPLDPANCYGLTDSSGTLWIVAQAGNYGGWYSRIWWFPKDGSSSGYVLFNTLVGWLAYGGVTRIGSTYYVLACKIGTNGPDYSTWRVLKYNTTTYAYNGYFDVNHTAPAGARPSIGNDGTNLLLGLISSTGSLYARVVDTNGTQASQTLLDSAWGKSTSATSFHRTATGLAATRWVVSTDSLVRVYTTAGVRVPSEEWPLAAVRCRGMVLTDVWHTFHGDKVYNHTWNAGPAALGYAWRDDDPAGVGTTETRPTSKVLTPPRFARWQVTLPSRPPDDGTPDGANTASIYAGTPLIRQTILPEGTLSVVLDTILTAGATPSPVNGFTTGGRTGAIGSLVSTEADALGVPLSRIAGKGQPRLAKLIQSGRVSVVPSAANTPTVVHVDFPVPFDTVPNVTATARTSVPGTTVTGVSVLNETTTGFDVVVTRTNTTSTPVGWTATTAT